MKSADKTNKIIFAFFFLLFFLILLKNSFNYLDPDFGWHIRIGAEILAKKQLPTIEHFDTPLLGTAWADHEWLANVFSYFFYEKFGYTVLTFIFTIFPLATIITLLIHTKKIYNKKIDTVWLLLTGLGLYTILPHSGVRIQEITYLFFAIELFLISHYLQYKRAFILLWLFPLMSLWANLHGGFLLGLVTPLIIIFFKSAEIIINKIFPRITFIDKNSLLSGKHIKILTFAAFINLSAALATPYGGKLFDFLLSYKDTYYLTHIQEWLPIHYYPINIPQILYLALISSLFIIIPLAARIKLLKNFKIDISQIGLMFILAYMAVKSRRHFPLFFVASFPYFYATLTHLYRENTKPLFTSKNFFYKNIVNFFLTSSLLLIISYHLATIKIVAKPFENYCNFYPCQGWQYLRDNRELSGKKILNEYGWGGYLLWVWPEKQIFIDGRLPQKELNGKSFLEEFLNFYTEGKQKEKLDEYGIEVVFIKKSWKFATFNWFEKYILGLNQEIYNNKKNYLKDYLTNSPQWLLQYSDQSSLIYAKR